MKMSTLLFETYVFLGESLFYFAHLPPGSSNPAMANEHIIHVAVWWPKRVYLSHPQEFSVQCPPKFDNTAKSKVRYESKSAVMMSASTFYRPSREETGEYYLMDVVGDEWMFCCVCRIHGLLNTVFGRSTLIFLYFRILYFRILSLHHIISLLPHTWFIIWCIFVYYAKQNNH